MEYGGEPKFVVKISQMAWQLMEDNFLHTQALKRKIKEKYIKNNLMTLIS